MLMNLCKNGELPVSEAKARMLSANLCTNYLECSALTQHNLKEVFDAAILAALRGKKMPTNPVTNSLATKSTNGIRLTTTREPREPREQRGILANGNSENAGKDGKKSNRLRQGIKKIVTLTKKFL